MKDREEEEDLKWFGNIPTCIQCAKKKDLIQSKKIITTQFS